jgi:hypothetical protein
VGGFKDAQGKAKNKKRVVDYIRLALWHFREAAFGHA